MGEDRTATMRDAIAAHVRDGDVVALEGFTHLIPVAAGHEIIRQRRRGLTLVRMTADIVVDQLVAAGAVGKLISSFVGNSAVGSLHELRRRIEHADPEPLEFEEYSHYGLLGRYLAGAQGLPFYPLRSYAGSDLPEVNPNIRQVRSPFDDGSVVHAVPPLNPDVAILHAQRADAAGNAQVWGMLGAQQEVAFAARKVIVVVEEVVAPEVIRSDPNRTLIPEFLVDAVVECPRGAHPSYVQGYYERDGAFYRAWPGISRDPRRLREWLQEWVHDLDDHQQYLARLGGSHWDDLTPRPAPSAPVDYGAARD